MNPRREPSETTILQPSEDGWENSSLLAGFDDWRSYAFCYRRAAEELAKRFPVPLDAPEAIFLPIIYLYRHYVEASLKGILADACTAYSLNLNVPTDHDLETLWRQVRIQMDAKAGVLDREWFDRADQLIAELARVDPGSMHFRYPFDKRGARLLTPGFTISTMRVREAMDDVCFVLDNLAGYLSALIDFDTPEGGIPPATA